MEDAIVELLRRRFGARAPGLRCGIGDDAAVFEPPGADELWVMTTDLLLEEIDFKRRWTTPEALGHKALAVNLSDVAAMGAQPRFYTVGLGIPRGLREPWIDRLYRGMAALGASHRTVLVGGDLSRSESGIHISVTLLGETKGRKFVRRTGGRPGDILYVTGTLGRAAAGLCLLASGRRQWGGAAGREALEAQRRPVPRCDVGLWLARCGLPSAMLDLSDGLSMDLPRLCSASGTGAVLDLWKLPLFEPARSWGLDPLELALHGGEDYELLLSIRPERTALLERAYPASFPPLTCIGLLTPRAGVVARFQPNGRPRRLRRLGFDHFRPNPR